MRHQPNIDDDDDDDVDDDDDDDDEGGYGDDEHWANFGQNISNFFGRGEDPPQSFSIFCQMRSLN